MARNCAKKLASVVGKQFGGCDDTDDNLFIVGCWESYYDDNENTFVLEEVVDEQGKLDDISPYLTPKEFCDSAQFAIKMVNVYRSNVKKH